VDDSQRFQQIDGFGASLTDAAAWLFAKNSPGADRCRLQDALHRKEGIALSFLRQPIGSPTWRRPSIPMTIFACRQPRPAPPSRVNDYNLEHYSIKHDEEYILPQLRKALALNPI